MKKKLLKKRIYLYRFFVSSDLKKIIEIKRKNIFHPMIDVLSKIINRYVI
jgi:hypothetical protein